MRQAFGSKDVCQHLMANFLSLLGSAFYHWLVLEGKGYGPRYESSGNTSIHRHRSVPPSIAICSADIIGKNKGCAHGVGKTEMFDIGVVVLHGVWTNNNKGQWLCMK
jgi:hypothetical protein